MRILVVGAGAMGTALAGLLSPAHGVLLWCRRAELAAELGQRRENRRYLPGYRIPETVALTSGPGADLASFEGLVLAVPTQHLRATAQALGLKNFAGSLVSTAKGLEIGTSKTPCAILEDLGCAAKNILALSGPSLAGEMVRGLPTSLVLAGNSAALRSRLATAFATPTLRIYHGADRIGVELGGALKNIIAIAAGMSDGLGFGMNTKSAIITRGLAEITKYSLAQGARRETFYGLSGIGDLVTTCCSPDSRNRSFGFAQVTDPASFKLEEHLAEGAYTVRSLVQELDAAGGPEMPLCRAVHAVVAEGREAHKVMRELLNRPLKQED